MGKAKLNIPMCAALILLLLTMVTTHMTSGLYARYAASASGEDSARVAKFDVITSLDNQDILLDCTANTSSGVYNIKIQNNSEVAIEYILNVRIVPKGATTALDGTDMNAYMAETKDTNGNDIFEKITFSNSMIFTRDQTPLLPGEEREHKLKLEIYDWGTISQDAPNSETYQRDFDITVEIQATQVD